MSPLQMPFVCEASGLALAQRVAEKQELNLWQCNLSADSPGWWPQRAGGARAPDVGGGAKGGSRSWMGQVP